VRQDAVGAQLARARVVGARLRELGIDLTDLRLEIGIVEAQNDVAALTWSPMSGPNQTTRDSI